MDDDAVEDNNGDAGVVEEVIVRGGAVDGRHDGAGVADCDDGDGGVAGTFFRRGIKPVIKLHACNYK